MFSTRTSLLHSFRMAPAPVLPFSACRARTLCRADVHLRVSAWELLPPTPPVPYFNSSRMPPLGRRVPRPGVHPAPSPHPVLACAVTQSVSMGARRGPSVVRLWSP